MPLRKLAAILFIFTTIFDFLVSLGISFTPSRLGLVSVQLRGVPRVCSAGCVACRWILDILVIVNLLLRPIRGFLELITQLGSL